MIYSGAAPDAVEENFGSVPRSLFSLFRLMNGDNNVAAAVCVTTSGKLLFVAFMVLANWAILAILTSVVSENMITSSNKVLEEEERKDSAARHQERVGRLRALFREIDTDGSGAISHTEWSEMLKDEGLLHELCDAACVSLRDLHELFNCLAVDPLQTRKSVSGFEDDEEADRPVRGDSRLAKSAERILYYDAFIDQLENESRPVDKRAVLRLMSRLQEFENRIEARLDQIDGAKS
mmetsp:Transcript_47749/g.134464  ORF Transcript_47749/g.134464 Transcript_47749/m.134464 type:complete len:236 (+) Transcript_47749:54-761(+)